MDTASHLKKVGAISGFLLTGPLASHIAKLNSPILNPPVGALSDFWLGPALLVGILVTTFLPLLYKKTGSKKPIVGALLFACASVGLYGWSLLHYGRPIDIPRRGIHDFVIVGTERSDFARTFFDGVGDVDMLEQRGWDDQSFTLYWTKWSLEESRLIVLTGYIFTIIFVNLAVSSIAAQTIPSGPKCSGKEQITNT